MQAYHIQDVGVQLVEHLLEGGARVCHPQGSIKSLLDDWTHQRRLGKSARMRSRFWRVWWAGGWVGGGMLLAGLSWMARNGGISPLWGVGLVRGEGHHGR